MKKLLMLIIIIFLVGCAVSEQPEEVLTDQQIAEIDQIQENKFEEDFPTSELKSIAEVDAVPSEGSIEFTGEVNTILPILDESVGVKMMTTGKLTFSIGDSNKVSGSGDGTVDVTLNSDIGIAKCEGTKKITVKYDVEGSYFPETDEIIFISKNVKPATDQMVLNCPYEYGGDLTYDLTVPILLFADQAGDAKVTMLLTKPGEIIKTINHDVPSWDTSLPVKWTLKPILVKYDEFDFDVDVNPAVVEVEQGSKAEVQVVVKKVRGEAKPVGLKVTQWPSIVSFLTNTQVTPTETTTLNIETTCDTNPDSYLFTVTGETSGTFKSSADAVNVIVKKSAGCS